MSGNISPQVVMRIVFLSLCFLLLGRQMPTRAQESRRDALLESAAELLRMDDNRLYLWLVDPLVINDEYRIEITGRQSDTHRVSIGESVDRIVISESLSDSLVGLVQDLEEPEIRVSFDAAGLAADTVLIGVPATFLAYYDSLDAAPGVIGATHRLVPFGVLEEAEIDFTVGKLNLLLLPETEVDSRFECDYRVYRTGRLAEWYLLCDLPDYDLAPAAFSYCLKGFLASPAGAPRSFVISSRDLQRFFPHHLESAAGLFSQMPAASESRRCIFPATLEFPGLVKRVDAQLRRCGGSLAFVAPPDSSKVALSVSLVTEARAENAAGAAMTLLRQAIDLDMSWSSRARELINGESGRKGEDVALRLEALSRTLASEIRVVPLGISPMLIVARPEAHLLCYRGALVSFRDFYLVSPK